MTTGVRNNYARVGLVLFISLLISSAWLVFPYLIQGKQLLSTVAVTDDIDGGFVLLHAYKMSIEFVLDDFPATGDVLSAPSRSLDARYIYVSNITSGEVYSLNAYSRIIFNTFEIGGKAARPYTTPQGAFLYMMDAASGRFVSVEQRGFTKFAELSFEHGVDLVVVGRFDRMNLLASTTDQRWSIFDNVSQKIVATGRFNGVPIGALGSADGKYAYVAFADAAEVAIVDLEDQAVSYTAATDNGSAAFTVGLSNNVCH